MNPALLGYLVIFLPAILMCIVYHITTYIELKRENERLVPENIKLQNAADKALDKVKEHQRRYAELLTKYEYLRDAVTEDNYLLQFDRLNKTIELLREENEGLRSERDYLNHRIFDMEFDQRWNNNGFG